MKILVIGGGGREHSIVWKLAQSRSVEKIWCAPGNGGISQQAECIAADPEDVASLADLAEKVGTDLTVVGPELPLVGGVGDEFRRRGLKIIAPDKASARLEGSKVYAKDFLNRYGIPTAKSYGVFDSAGPALQFLEMAAYPLVLKADGLCAGKGVLVAKSYPEAADFVDRVLTRGEFGEGGKALLIEEALRGDELSYIVLSDGLRFAPLVPTRDHKRAFDGDRGPNTGGMGAYSCDGIIAPDVERRILKEVVQPTMAALPKEGCIYRGFLYFGLMLTAAGPKVLEFNCRLGDPETQAIIARMDFDLADTLAAAADGKIDPERFRWKPGASICVVMASGGYPGSYSSGKRIQGLAEAGRIPEVAIFHAGTRRDGNDYYTSSGRVLGVTAWRPNLNQARAAAYEAVKAIRFAECHYRGDIAQAACATADAGRA